MEVVAKKIRRGKIKHVNRAQAQVGLGSASFGGGGGNSDAV